jgi:hypothetical protein
LQTQDIKDGSESPFCSLVLLTRGPAVLRAADIQRRITRWTGLQFTGGNDAENFLVGEGDLVMCKLAREHLFVLTAVQRPYWESEDIWPYAETVEARGGASLAEQMTSCQGAILIDRHVVQDARRAAWYLCKLAAAAMDRDTPVLVAPMCWNVRPVSEKLRQALAEAADCMDLLAYLLNLRTVQWDGPDGEGQTWFLCNGMHVFGLPDVGMCAPPGREQETAAAVQTVAAHMVRRGAPLPAGDTVSFEGAPAPLGTVRVIEAQYEPSPYAAFGALGLEFVA